MPFFDTEFVRKELDLAFIQNSELRLLNLIKSNSFLLSELYDRHYGIRPNFNEVSFGDKYRCDFCWLNDNSDGAEWVIVEIEKPKMKLFTKQGEPTSDLNHAIEQIKSWQRYFDRFPIGLPETINGATSDILRGFYEKWYTPKNMAVAIVGDIEPKKAEDLIKKYFNFKEKTQFTQGKDYKLKDLKNSYIVFQVSFISFLKRFLVVKSISNSVDK